MVTRELLLKALHALAKPSESLLERDEGASTPLIGNLQDFLPTKPKLILPPTFVDGEKHYNMIALAGALRSFGSNEEEIFNTLLVYKKTRCTQDFDNSGLQQIARDYARKDCNLSMKALIECASEEKAATAEQQQKLKLAFDFASKQLGSGADLGEVLTKVKLAIEQHAHSEAQEFSSLTSAELDAADLHTQYLVERIMAAGQPCVMAASKKSLKTTLAIDLALSLASGDRFVGEFYVPEPVRVAMMIGESGDATTQETARRIAWAKQLKNLSDYTNAIWSFTLPRLGQPQTKQELRRFITKHALRVLIIDPAYLCLDLGDGAGNLFTVGPKLLELTEIGQETNCTIVIIHHCRKNSTDPFAVPELESISWAGFQEWARQWILIGRREAYNPDAAGSHRLWLSVGGSAGHSGLWGLDVEEGSRTDRNGRRWDVTVDGASKVFAENIERGESAKEERERSKADRKVAADAEKLLQQYRKKPDGDTPKFFREAAGMSGTRFTPANQKLLDDRLIEPCRIKKNTREEPAFRLIQGGGTVPGLPGQIPPVPPCSVVVGLTPIRGVPPTTTHRPHAQAGLIEVESVPAEFDDLFSGGRPA